METRTEWEPRAGQSRRQHDLAGEHAFTDIGQLVLLAVFMAVWITDSFIVRLSVFPAAHVPAFIRWPAGLAVVAAGVLLVMLSFYLFVSRHEEKLLLAMFGSRYRDYRAATPMFFPLRFRASKRAGRSP